MISRGSGKKNGKKEKERLLLLLLNYTLGIEIAALVQCPNPLHIVPQIYLYIYR